MMIKQTNRSEKMKAYLHHPAPHSAARPGEAAISNLMFMQLYSLMHFIIIDFFLACHMFTLL